MLSSDESDSLDDESDEFGSKSGSSDTYYFHTFSLRSEESVDDAVASNIFAQKGVESKDGRLLSIFMRLN